MPTDTEAILGTLRDATHYTPYQGKLNLVGGFVRDKVMGRVSATDDIDIVLEGDALALAQFLFERGVTQYHPVVYPRFGTAMIVVGSRDIELVTARIESYASDSRKPDQVRPGTLADDARRRDFTINTLLENLHTGEITDPLGLAYTDLQAHIIRTPTDPALTFQDDPLRMLRAVRFAARFGFTIAPPTWDALTAHASRLAIISAERIQEEFGKTLSTTRASLGLTLLKDSGLLAQFTPGTFGNGRSHPERLPRLRCLDTHAESPRQPAPGRPLGPAPGGPCCTTSASPAPAPWTTQATSTSTAIKMSARR